MKKIFLLTASLVIVFLTQAQSLQSGHVPITGPLKAPINGNLTPDFAELTLPSAAVMAKQGFENTNPSVTRQAAGQLTIYQNPVVGNLQFSYQFAQGGTLSATVLNLTGQQVAVMSPTPYYSGVATQTIVLNQLPAGVYYLRLQLQTAAGLQQLSRSFVVAH